MLPYNCGKLCCTLDRDTDLSLLLIEEAPMSLKRRQFTREFKLQVLQNADSGKS